MCFYAPDNSVFVGVILEELTDSFLVGASAMLRMGQDRKVIAEEISTQPVIRVLKSSLKYMVAPTEMTVYHYFAFLEKFGYNKLPDYFTDARKEYISSIRSDSKYNVPLNLEPNETKPEVPGDSEHSFTPHTQSESIH